MRQVLLKFIKGFVVVILLILSGRVSMAANYYVSNTGNDNSSGTSMVMAWKTIAKVNSHNYLPGDSVLFQANGIWRDMLIIKNSGTNKKCIVYSRYGSGSNPSIFGSERAGRWVPSGVPNIWKNTKSFNNPRDNYYNISEIFFNNPDGSVSWGIFQTFNTGFTGLTKDLHWTWIDNKVYLFCLSDPNIKFTAVEVPQRHYCIRMLENSPAQYIEFNGLDLYYSRGMGFNGGYPERVASGLTFRKLHIGWIGCKGGPAAYGISTFHSDLLVEDCEINDCGRRGISYNVYTASAIDHHNIVVRNNYFHDGQHTTSLDLAAMPHCAGTIFRDVYFYNNIIEEDTSIVVGQNDNYTTNQIFVQEGGAYINNVFIYCNIFKNSTARHILIEGGDTIYIWNNTVYGFNQNGIRAPYGAACFNRTNWVDLRNNIFYLNLTSATEDYGVFMYYAGSEYLARDYNLYYQLHPKKFFTGGLHGNYTNYSWGLYLFKNPNFDKHSPRPQDPKFVSIFDDLSLSEGSPAIGAGVKINMIKTDIAGNPMNDPPDLGAIQFVGGKDMQRQLNQ